MTRRAVLLLAILVAAVTGCGSHSAKNTASAAAGAPVPVPTVPASCRVGSEARQPLPDPHCTPGVLATGIGKLQLCPHLSSAVVRNVTATTKAQVRTVYGDHQRGEIDHLVSLELGGSNDVRNLWPEDGPIPNTKDALEDKLHTDVCDGTVSLATAQQAIRTDWVTAYRRYVGPLP